MLVVGNGPNNTDYPNACDGKFAENFLTMPLSWGGTAFTDVNALGSLSEAGKTYVTFQRTSGNAMMMYCLAGFLLGANGSNAYFGHGDFFDSAHPYGFGGWYPEFVTAQAVGSPTNSYYTLQSVYARDFTNGKVLFNPTGNSYTVNLQGTYKTLTSIAVTSIVLPPHSGVILLLT
jgi:hypothetical protein